MQQEMTETLVSFKIAELAKKKGFKTPVWDYFRVWYNDTQEGCKTQRKDYNSFFDTIDPKEEFFSRPSADLLQKWLRKVHNIHIAILPKILPSNEVKYYCFKGKLKKDFENLYNTYEEALNEALFQALKLLPDKQN